jgi:hypothetical protein
MNETLRQQEFASRIQEIDPLNNPIIPWGQIPDFLYSPAHASQSMFERQKKIDETKATIIPLAQEMFKGTGIIDSDKTLSQDDIDQIFRFFDRVKPLVDHKLQSNYWNHITAAYARAAALTEYCYPEDTQTQYLLQTRLLFHDIGRLFDAEDYRLNDMLADEFFAEVGIHEHVTKGMLPLDRVLGLAEPKVTTTDSYDPTDSVNNEHIMVLDIADNFGRVDDNGIFLSDETIMGYIAATPKRNPKKLFEEQRRGVDAFFSNNGAIHQQYVRILNDGIATLTSKLQSQDKTWEQCAERAQHIMHEARQRQFTFSTERILEEEPVHTIVFDLGDVVFGADDTDLFKHITDKVRVFFAKECTQEQIRDAVVKHLDLGMTAKTQEEQLQYLHAFYREIGISIFKSTNMIRLVSLPFQNPNLYKKRQEMVDLINNILTKTNVDIVMLSDMIAPVKQPVSAFLKQTIPLLYNERYKDRVRINFSPDLGVAKRSEGTEAFAKVFSHVPQEKRMGCVFIDDKKAYTDKAQSFGIRSIQFDNTIPHIDTLLHQAIKKNLSI